jgi:hypothetical protein
MPSTYSPLKIELPATGEQSGTWGNTTNTNLGTALEEAIVGSASVTFASGNVTLTLTDTNASQPARNLRLNLIGVTGGSTRTLTVPAIEKLYLVSNNCADPITVGNTTGATVTVPAGNNIFIYNDGTDVLNAITYITALNAVSVSAGSVTTTQVDIVSQGDLRLQDTTGGEYVALQAPGTIASSYTLTLPVDDGTSGQALITDGSGALSWSTAAAGDVYGPASATDNAIARFDGTTGKIIQNSVVTIADSTGNMAGVGTISSGAITSSSLTSGRVLYAGTSGLIQDDADFTFNGTTVTMANDASISGLTVGKGGGAQVTNSSFGSNVLGVNTSGTENSGVGTSALFSNTTGVSNTAVGRTALQNNTTGSNNTAVGRYASAANTTGGSNTSVGTDALQANTTADNNTAVGYQAGYSNTTGALNAILGTQALYTNTTGSQNIAVGYRAAYANTTGAGSVAIGYTALSSITTGNFSVGIGYEALRDSNSSGVNTAIGLQALRVNTTGGDNLALGGGNGATYTATMASNTTGSYNTGVGFGALASNTTASNNTAVGYHAKYSNVTGANSSAVGYQALYSDTGDWNTAIGHQAAYSNTSGKVTAIGTLALQANTTGNANVAVGGYDGSGAFGFPALYSNTTGSNNTAVGVAALQANTTASDNTAVGYQAGYTNQTGNRNTFLGNLAGYTSNVSGNASNTCIGYVAGYTLTTGTTNTFIGNNSGSSITTGIQNSILGSFNGNQNGLDIRTAANYAVISDGAGTPLISTSNGGTTALQGAIPNSGTGITFPATQSASSNANTLDDYEEGTWTPVIMPSAGSLTSYTSSGTYVKVGKTVTINFQISIVTQGTASGVGNLSAFPFTSHSPSAGNRSAIGVARENAATGNIYQFYINSGATTGDIRTLTNGNIVWDDGYQYIFTITYQSAT